MTKRRFFRVSNGLQGKRQLIYYRAAEPVCLRRLPGVLNVVQDSRMLQPYMARI